jgi:hypothetical protein
MVNLIPNKHWNTILKFVMIFGFGILAGKPVVDAFQGAVTSTTELEQKSVKADSQPE